MLELNFITKNMWDMLTEYYPYVKDLLCVR